MFLNSLAINPILISQSNKTLKTIVFYPKENLSFITAKPTLIFTPVHADSMHSVIIIHRQTVIILKLLHTLIRLTVLLRKHIFQTLIISVKILPFILERKSHDYACDQILLVKSLHIHQAIRIIRKIPTKTPPVAPIPVQIA